MTELCSCKELQLIEVLLLTVYIVFREAGKLSTEDSAILKDLSSKMQRRKNKFRDLEDVLPHKHG